MAGDLGSELARRESNTLRVEQYFRAHVGQWVDTRTLERLGGRNAWRTRVSNARKVFCEELGWPFPVKAGPDPIANRQYLCGEEIVSEYRYWPHEPLGRDATIPSPPAEPRPAGLLFDLHPRS